MSTQPRQKIPHFLLIKSVLVLTIIMILTLGLNITTIRAEGEQADNLKIYLGGQAGDDNNDGLSSITAVASFAKAKELAIANQRITTIVIQETLKLNGEITLEGTKAKLMRAQDFNGVLITVAANQELVLKNITIDGNLANKNITGEMIFLDRGSNLSLLDGAVLQNNKRFHIKNVRDRGGAISAVNANIYVDGATITNNEAVSGGGVYLSGSTMTVKRGNFLNNIARKMYDSSLRQRYGAGGGICLFTGSSLTIEDGAVFKGNMAGEVGGAISVGDVDWGEPCTLTMNGGLIEANEAGASGGGIFVQSGAFDRYPSKAYIHAGSIIYNKMNGTGRTEKAFGGGGIYVNGAPEILYDYHAYNGELYINNVVITENKAKVEGGGIASCPVSNTRLLAENTAAIFNNTTVFPNRARDLFIMSNSRYGHHSGLAKLKISNRMLGGRPYNWQDLHGVPVDSEQLLPVLPDNETIALNAGNNYTLAEFKPLAKVFIMHNESTTRGGGIGSNGTIIIGSDNERDLEIVKDFADGVAAEPVELELRAKTATSDYLVEKITLNSSNSFKHTFKNLPRTVLGQGLENCFYIKELGDKFIPEISPVHTRTVSKKLSFMLSRSNISDLDNITKAYTDKYIDDANLFDMDAWQLKDFDVTFNLKTKAGVNLQTGKMHYSGADYNWQGELNFSDIPINKEPVEVEYYDLNGAFIDPALLNYDLILDERDDKTVLQVPKLQPIRIKNPTGDEQVLEVTDIKHGLAPGMASEYYQINVLNKKKPEEPKQDVPVDPKPKPPVEPFNPKPEIPVITNPAPQTPEVPGDLSKIPNTGEADKYGTCKHLFLGLSLALLLSFVIMWRRRLNCHVTR